MKNDQGIVFNANNKILSLLFVFTVSQTNKQFIIWVKLQLLTFLNRQICFSV